MTNKQKVCGMIGLATRAGKTTFGTEACMSGIEKKRTKLIIVAEDSADRTKLNFEKACSSKQIEFRIYLNIEEISSSIGKQNKAVVGINDINFSNEILKIIDGGEVIG